MAATGEGCRRDSAPLRALPCPPFLWERPWQPGSRFSRTHHGEYAFRLRAKEGELIATGESKKTKAKARESVLARLKATPKAKIDDLTEARPVT